MVTIKSYPNPTASILNIEGLKGKTSYYVTDMAGRIVLKANAINVLADNITKVNVAHFIGGAYFLYYQSENRSGVIRFIKK